MPMEAIRCVVETEAENRRKMADTEAACAGVLAEAERTGQALLEAARETSAANGQAQLRQAEERAAHRIAELETETAETCRCLQERAQSRMEDAVQLIIERIANG